MIDEAVLRFDDCDTWQCVLVSIINDDVMEDTEMFSVTLEQAPIGYNSTITFDPQVANVTIDDDDGIINFRLLFVTLYLCSCHCWLR